MNELKIDYSSKEKYLESKKRIIKFIRNSIHLDENRKNLKGINCYGFALGFDFDFIDVDKNSLWNFLTPGNIGDALSDKRQPYSKINDNNFESKLLYDMNTLGIQLEYAHEYDESICRLDSDNYLTWLISAYVGKNGNGESEDCHFMRKLPNGIWTHKFGHKSEDILYSFKSEKYLATEFNNLTYEQVGVYKLRLKR